MLKCEDCQERKAVLTLRFPDGHPVKYCKKCYNELKKDYLAIHIPTPIYINKREV